MKKVSASRRKRLVANWPQVSTIARIRSENIGTAISYISIGNRLEFRSTRHRRTTTRPRFCLCSSSHNLREVSDCYETFTSPIFTSSGEHCHLASCLAVCLAANLSFPTRAVGGTLSAGRSA